MRPKMCIRDRDSIAYYEQRLANQEDLRGNISPETITRYRELIGDNVYICLLYTSGHVPGGCLHRCHQ